MKDMSVIEVTGFVFSRYKKLARFVAGKVIELTKQPDNLDVAIKFVSAREIMRLNNETRGINKVTDVLSYPAFNLSAGEKLNVHSEEALMNTLENGSIHFGDMAICFSKARCQAKEFGTSVALELKKLVIHSMLHLMGYDHIKDEDYEIMNKKEIEIDKKINLEAM